MRITVKQLKQLIRETVEDIDRMDLERQAGNLPSKKENLFQRYRSLYKDMHGHSPYWLTKEEVSKMPENVLADMVEYLESRYDEVIKAREQEAEEDKKYYEELKEKHAEAAELGYEGDDLENLPKKSGMGKRLAESIKKAVRDSLK